MAKIELPYLNAFKDRHGRMRYYVRLSGKRTALPGEPGSPEFMAAYEAAIAGRRKPEPKTRPRDFSRLIEEYYQSPDWKGLRASTKRAYRSVIEAIREDVGARSVAGLRYEHVEKMIGRLSDTPAAANNRLKRLRTLVRYAIKKRWITEDPTIGVGFYKGGEFHTWTAAERDTFEKRWAPGTRPRLAYALHLYTGQRKQAVRVMSWADIEAGAIRVEQEKTGAKLWIPIHPELAAELARHPRRHMLILTHGRGAGYTDGGYGNWFREACDAAGLPSRCSSHGLRKAAAARLAEAGCSANQIAAITGHKSLKEVERYTRAAEQKTLAKAAILRLSGKPSPE